MTTPDLAALRGDRGEARAHYQRAVEMSPRSSAPVRLLAMAAAEPGAQEADVLQAIESLQQADADGNEWPPSSIDLALLATARGDGPSALAALDRAIELGYRDSAWLLVDPGLAALREQPGFWLGVERIRALVAAERERVLGADWLPDGFLDAAR